MLTLQPALRPRRPDGRFGVALAGGGPLGAFYELGALQAIAESIDGLALDDLYAYVGVSSGSVLAAGLANGLSPVDLGRIVISNESGHDPADPGLFLQPAWSEHARRLAAVPRLALRALVDYARAPLTRNVAEVLAPLASALPAGLLDGEPFERYLRQLFTSGGRTNDFRRLGRHLYIVATDLDTGEAKRFGEKGSDAVAISKAVQASTALPGLYAPVVIDGATYADGALLRTMHASLVLEAGAQLVICINPLVSFDASAGHSHAPLTRLSDYGLPAVLGQTFRSLIQSRMLVGMAGYRARFPTSDTLLLQPDRDDAKMFFANVFRYSDRRRLVDHAYDCTRRDLLAQARPLAPILKRHGLALRRAVLREAGRSFSGALERQRQANRRVVSDLQQALDRLDSLIG